MIKNSLLIVIAVLSVLFFVTACTTDNQQEIEPEEKSDNNESGKQSDVIKQEPEEEKLQLPKASLQKKDHGEQVQLLQKALNEIGYELTVNGDYDETTTWAITDFQLQDENLLATGVYNEETNVAVEKFFSDGENEFKPGKGLPYTVENTTTDSGTEVLVNPYDQLALVNKKYGLPKDYIPDDLVIPNVRFSFTEDLPKKQLRKIAADALEEMFNAADKKGLNLFAQSGYRSYERQDAIFASNASQHGEDAANQFSARPGESEHQTGLSMDVTSPEVNNKLITAFGDTAEGKWVKENAAEFGFIIRYPEGKEEITKYQYEPWHLRYVGKKAATTIMNEGLTLEEYLETD
ncbi:D-alanyl-D-alanine carboxypeptidase family protein [Virgibacillus sp. C22-A2]|uniref:D-alanyl-D-alanine carboxypeptidase family protein n=1 Tax=Virgibacillus tibetensis TaxID=3042313 RepID=A0ABU6KHK7_9BACI|nr:D-alanyl-D-alanine carboxypeptidase family protein [Virgibacillus sp. C22-A2]